MSIANALYCLSDFDMRRWFIMAQLVTEHRRIELARSHRAALVGVRARMRPANRTMFQRLSFVVMVPFVRTLRLATGLRHQKFLFPVSPHGRSRRLRAVFAPSGLAQTVIPRPNAGFSVLSVRTLDLLAAFRSRASHVMSLRTIFPEQPSS